MYSPNKENKPELIKIPVYNSFLRINQIREAILINPGEAKSKCKVLTTDSVILVNNDLITFLK
jgi:hypothetical protein